MCGKTFLGNNRKSSYCSSACALRGEKKMALSRVIVGYMAKEKRDIMWIDIIGNVINNTKLNMPGGTRGNLICQIFKEFHKREKAKLIAPTGEEGV